MQKGYTDGGPWCGNQVRVGLVLIRGYSESGHTYALELEQNGGGVKKGASQGGRQRGDKRKEGKREVVP